MSRFEIRMFGGLRVIRDGDEINVSGSKQRALLAILAISPNLTVSTDRIIHDLWHDDPPSRPISTLRYHLSKLRSQLHEPDEDRDTFIVTEAGGYAMAIDPLLIDTIRHERLVEEVAGMIEANPGAARGLVDEAASIATGPPLPEFAYEEFAARFVRHVEATVLRCRLLDVDQDIAQGEYERSTAALEALARENPYDEGIYGRLMTSLYRSGRAYDALEVFQTARSRLGEDLGLEPSPELADLEDQILLHRLPSAPKARSHRALPPETSTMIGRDEEVDVLDRVTHGHRLVTLTGLPGVGKTRVALRYAHSLDMAIWVSIPREGSSTEIEGLLRSATQRALPHLSFDGADAFGSLAVVDSTIFIDGAHRSAATAGIVEELLRSAPDVKIVVTSRSPLDIDGEHVLIVPPLGERQSLELFRQRSSDPHFDEPSIDAIASGIPSVIESAALAYRRTGSTADLPDEWQPDEAGYGSWAEDQGPFVLGLALLREPFDIGAVLASGPGAKEAVHLADALIDSGVMLNTDGGWAVHPLVRRYLLSTMTADTARAGLGLAIEMRDLRLSNRAVERLILQARRFGLEAEVDRCLAALASTWWHEGPRTGRAAVIGAEAGDALDDDDPEREHLLYLGAHFALIDNDLPQAVDLIHRHAQSIEKLGPRARSRHHQLVADLAMYQGDLQTAIDKNMQAARTAMAADLPNTTHLLASTGFVDTMVHDGVADGHAERLMAAAAAHRQDIGPALAAELGGLDAYLRGDDDKARLLLALAIDEYRELGRPAWSTAAVAILAHLECRRDDPERALSIITMHESVSPGDSPGAVAGPKAAALTTRGDVEAARVALRDGASSIANHSNPVWTFRLLLGAAQSAEKEPAVGVSAALSSQQALDTANRAGMRVSPADLDALEALAEGEPLEENALDQLRRL